jgi:ketosteroid isomerase-like protein
MLADMSALDFEAIVQAYSAAVASNDQSRIAALVTSDFKIWHNYTNVELGVDAGAAHRSRMYAACENVAFLITNTTRIPHGLIRESFVRGEARDGQAFATSYVACFHIDSEGRIYRIDEFVDTVGLAALGLFGEVSNDGAGHSG